jgi:CRP/FNR family transcriptional regulator, anaerobic regulatory protein
MSLAVALPTAAARTVDIPLRSSACNQCAARHLTFCNAMASQDLGRLAQVRTHQHVEEGETFVDEGESATHYFNVLEGAVKIYKLMADGRRVITGFLFAGDLLGLAFNDTYTYSAEALTPVKLCRFPRNQLSRLLDEYPKLEKRLLMIASNELAAAQEQMMLLGRKTAHERIASFLLTLVRREERLDGDAECIRLPMTRTDIADYLGLTTETASRVFTSLRRRGCIELENGSRVRILDRGTLEELASGLE